MQYIPYHLLGTTDNIIVDGAANSHTQLTLSHWPGSTTPKALKHDLSAGIVLNYLRHGEFHLDVAAASNNHFDEDGLIGLWALLNPHEALEREDLLLDVASAGDFGTYKDRDAARIAFVLNAWTRPEISPLNQGVFKLPYLEQTMVLYEELLPRLLNILDRFEYLEGYWKAQDQLLDKSEQQIGNGEIAIKEYPEVDLAIVQLPQAKSEKDAPQPWSSLVHEMAIHNATDMLRILLIHSQRYKFYYRYETWVQLASRQTMPRLDMSALAQQLTSEEEPGAIWRADSIDDIAPALSLEGAAKSAIAPDAITQTLRSYLATVAART